MTVQRAYWAILAMAVGVATVYFTSPQTRWIPAAVGVLRDELTERGFFNQPVDGKTALNESLFAGKSNYFNPYGNWTGSIRLAEVQGMTPAVGAILVRTGIQRFSNIKRADEKKRQPSASDRANIENNLAICRTLVDLCDKGSGQEPANAFWPMCRAAARWKLGAFEAARQDLEQASRCTVYDNHAWDEGDMRFAWRTDQVGAEVPMFRLAELSSVMFPEVSHYHVLEAYLLSNDDLRETIQQRIIWQKIGLLMCEKAAFPMERYVGLSLVKTSLQKPGVEWARGLSYSKKPQPSYSHEEFVAALGATSDRGSLAVLRSAELLAHERTEDWSKMALEHPADEFFDDRFDGFQAIGMALTIGGLLFWLSGVATGLVVIWSHTWRWPATFGWNLNAFAMYPLIAYNSGPTTGAGLGVLVAGVLLYLALCLGFSKLRSLTWVPVLLMILGLVAITLLDPPHYSFFCASSVLAILGAWGLSFAKQPTWWAKTAHASAIGILGLWVAFGHAVVAHRFDPGSVIVWAGGALSILLGVLAFWTPDKNRAYLSAGVATLVGCAGLIATTVTVLNVQKSATESIQAIHHRNDVLEAHVKKVLGH